MYYSAFNKWNVFDISLKNFYVYFRNGLLFEQKVYAISWAVTTDNYHEAVRQYKKKYHEPFPDHKTIKRWHEKLVATGNLSCNQAGQGRRVSASGDDTENGILRIIESEPGTSQRKREPM